MKRLFLLLFSLLMFLGLSPFFLLIAFLIIIVDKVNPIFIQDRVGENKNIISIFKFRTLSTYESKGVIKSVINNDDRITRLGKYLRLTNIDELPQIINILKGDINFIGPRPLAVSQDKKYEKIITNWNDRYIVKPGITGMSQSLGLSGGDNIDKYKLIIKLDLYYIRNKSFSLNCKIIIKTIKTILKF